MNRRPARLRAPCVLPEVYITAIGDPYRANGILMNQHSAPTRFPTLLPFAKFIRSTEFAYSATSCYPPVLSGDFARCTGKFLISFRRSRFLQILCRDCTISSRFTSTHEHNFQTQNVILNVNARKTFIS